MVENWIFATPHTYYQGFQCQKGIQFCSKFDPKSDVQRDTPERPPSYGPKSVPKRKGAEKAPKRISQGMPKWNQNDAEWRPRGSWNTAHIQSNPECLRWALEGASWGHLGPENITFSYNKGGHFVLFFFNIFGEKSGGTVPKKGQHSVLLSNISGWAPDSRLLKAAVMTRVQVEWAILIL